MAATITIKISKPADKRFYKFGISSSPDINTVTRWQVGNNVFAGVANGTYVTFAVDTRKPRAKALTRIETVNCSATSCRVLLGGIGNKIQSGCRIILGNTGKKVDYQLACKIKFAGIGKKTTTITSCKIAFGGIGNKIVLPPAPPVPVITLQPTGINYISGGTINFSVRATNYNSITWYREGANAAIGSGLTLSIQNGQQSSMARYYAKIIGTGGIIESNRVWATFSSSNNTSVPFTDWLDTDCLTNLNSPAIHYVENEYLRIGINLGVGACISVIQFKVNGVWSPNQVNNLDKGRQIGFAFNCIETSAAYVPAGMTWNTPNTPQRYLTAGYNPNQGGNWNNVGSPVVMFSRTATSITTVTHPIQFTSDNYYDETTEIHQTVEVLADRVRVTAVLKVRNFPNISAVSGGEFPFIFLEGNYTEFFPSANNKIDMRAFLGQLRPDNTKLTTYQPNPTKIFCPVRTDGLTFGIKVVSDFRDAIEMVCDYQTGFQNAIGQVELGSYLYLSTLKSVQVTNGDFSTTVDFMYHPNKTVNDYFNQL